MVTFAKRLRPSTKFEVRRPLRWEDTAHLVCQLSIYNSFPVIQTTIAKNHHFYVPRASQILKGVWCIQRPRRRCAATGGRCHTVAS